MVDDTWEHPFGLMDLDGNELEPDPALVSTHGGKPVVSVSEGEGTNANAYRTKQSRLGTWRSVSVNVNGTVETGTRVTAGLYGPPGCGAVTVTGARVTGGTVETGTRLTAGLYGPPGRGAVTGTGTGTWHGERITRNHNRNGAHLDPQNGLLGRLEARSTTKDEPRTAWTGHHRKVGCPVHAILDTKLAQRAQKDMPEAAEDTDEGSLEAPR